MGNFSKRHGYGTEPEITVREDAPDGLRYAVVAEAADLEVPAGDLREIICRVVRARPDSNNWSTGNIWAEVNDLIGSCDWWRVYDAAEAVYDHLWRMHPNDALKYQEAINSAMVEMGVGWGMEGGEILAREPELVEESLVAATEALERDGRDTALRELREARADISRRPEPDVTGAIQHVIAALECVARESAGDGATLGSLMKSHAAKLGIEKPLDSAIEKFWGYASDKGRHLKEGYAPTHREAALLLGVSSSVIVYLLWEEAQ